MATRCWHLPHHLEALLSILVQWLYGRVKVGKKWAGCGNGFVTFLDRMGWGMCFVTRELSEEVEEGLLQQGPSKLGQKVGRRQCTLTGEAHATAGTVHPCVASMTAFPGSSWAGHSQATCVFVKGHFQGAAEPKAFWQRDCS